MQNLVIDIGAVSAEDAVKNFGIRIGEPAVEGIKSMTEEKIRSF